jgi:hypothetical protein
LKIAALKHVFHHQAHHLLIASAFHVVHAFKRVQQVRSLKKPYLLSVRQLDLLLQRARIAVWVAHSKLKCVVTNSCVWFRLKMVEQMLVTLALRVALHGDTLRTKIASPSR